MAAETYLTTNMDKSVEKGFRHHIHTYLKDKSVAAEMYIPMTVPTPF